MTTRAAEPTGGANQARRRRRAGPLALALIAVSGSALIGGSTVVGAARAAAPPAAGCPDLEVVQLRGTGEAPGAGAALPALAAAVTEKSARTVATFALDYPATADLANSGPAGITALAAHIKAQVTACPNEKFVLSGYEQGALVISVVLTSQVTAAAPNPPDLAKYVAAVVLMDDPTQIAGDAANAGTGAAAGGISPRAAGALGPFAPLTRSYCEAGDAFCAGGDAAIAPDAYSTNYGTDAAGFVVGLTG